MDPATLASLSEDEQLQLALSLSNSSSGGMQRALDGIRSSRLTIPSLIVYFSADSNRPDPRVEDLSEEQRIQMAIEASKKEQEQRGAARELREQALRRNSSERLQVTGPPLSMPHNDIPGQLHVYI